MRSIPAGSVIERFVVVQPLGEGGMASVYLVRHRRLGSLHALKVLDTPSEKVRERLILEGRVQGQLRHPHIVAVQDVLEHQGCPALLMELVHGPSLLQWRADREPTLAQVDVLARGVLAGVAAAHALGLVHRDLKPHNVLLAVGAREIVPKVADFGVAKVLGGDGSDGAHHTRTGVAMGTPAYMAPEQIRDASRVDARADVFSLGALLFELACGRRPFEGADTFELFEAIVRGRRDPVQKAAPTLPARMADAIEQALQLAPSARPQDAGALLRAWSGDTGAPADAFSPGDLAAALASGVQLPTELRSNPGATPRLDTSTAERSPPAAPAPGVPRPGPVRPILTDETFYDVDLDAPTASDDPSRLLEQRLVSVVLAAAEDGRPIEISAARPPEAWSLSTAGTELGDLPAALRALSVPAGWLRDGLLVGTVADAPSALDQAALAARAALVVCERWPEARVAITTGRAALDDERPRGDAVDRAARLLSLAAGSEVAPNGPRVEIDELTADLLSSRYEVARAADRRWLGDERTSSDQERLLLGRPVPCVGREHELGILEALLAGCVDEGVAKAALVTAAPGTGKSRVRRELERRIAARQPDVRVSGAAGELLGAGAPYGLLSQALLHLAGVPLGASPERRRAGLASRVAEALPDGDRERVLDFLAELCRAPSAEPSPRLRVARSEPKVMSEQVTRAVVDLLRAECGRQPLVLVLEDLQWADASSVQVLDALPRALAGEPLLLVAFARPEVRELFPKLWSGAARTEIALAGLSRVAAERLVRAVRGAQASRETVARIVAQAAGNALLLEELVRADAEGRGEAPPGSVLAMVQARLSRHPPALRRVLRAASVFGETFWLGPLATLLGCTRDDADLRAALQMLVDTEVVDRRAEPRFPAEEEFTFRHQLVREAVYDLVRDDDRARWHRTAGSLLERLGERDPVLLAEHHERGGALPLACGFLLAAAEAAIAADDLVGALAHVTRALGTGPEGETRGRLLGLQARAYTWTLRWREGHDAACEALALLPPGGTPWFSAVWYALLLGGVLGEDATLTRVGPAFLAATPPREAHLLYVQTAASVTSVYALRGQRALATAFLDKLDAIAPALEPDDLQSRAWTNVGRNDHRRSFDLDPWQQERSAAEAARLMAEAENERDAVFFSIFHGQALGELGAIAEGEALLRETARRCDHRSERYLGTNCRLHLAELLLSAAPPLGDDDRLDEVAALAAAVLATENLGDGFRRWAWRLEAELALRRGDLAAAAERARDASQPGPAELRRLLAVAVLVRVRVRQGALAEALSHTDDALAWLAERGGAGYAEVPLRLALAGALSASGAVDSAHRERAQARAIVDRCAARIPEPAARQRFLAAAPISVLWRHESALFAAEATAAPLLR